MPSPRTSEVGQEVYYLGADAQEEDEPGELLERGEPLVAGAVLLWPLGVGCIEESAEQP